jgi:GNAT superfamily N-acetyltransferase
MARTERLLPERPLTAGDVPSALRLSEDAGWNQTTADWSYLLRAGHGFGVDDERGKLIATAITLPYDGGFGWISMMLVDPAERGAGIAKRLLATCIAALRNTGRVPVLDATPAGRPVYERAGFRDVGMLRRLRCRKTLSGPESEPAPLRPATPGDLVDIVRIDAAAFGARREMLLAELLSRMPHLAWVAEGNGRPEAFILARDGRTATQLGPIVAPDDDVALALIQTALRNVDGPVIIDVPDEQAKLQRALLGVGFLEERPLLRMAHESTRKYGDQRGLFAIAGPELG